MSNEANQQDLASLLKVARWSWKDIGVVLSSCLFGPALAAVWTVAEPLLGVNAIKIEKLGACAPWIFGVIVVVVAVGQRLRVKARAWEGVARLAETAMTPMSPDPLLSLRTPDASVPATVALLERIARSSDEPAVVSDLVTGWHDGAAILVMLRNLGLISIAPIAGTLAVRAVSSVAADFLLSTSLQLEERAPFVGSFADVEQNVRELYRLREFIRQMEQNRVDYVKAGGRSPRVARQVKSALIIIKASFDGEECILMQWSESWGRRGGDSGVSGNSSSGYYWFIGGVLEPKDGGDFLKCAAREVSEEVGVDAGDLQLIAQELFTCTDTRVSRRKGLYSQLEYHVFGATLRPGPVVSQIVKRRWVREFSVHTSRGVGMIPRKMEWRTLSEIKSDLLLREDAGTIVDELEKHIGEAPLQPRP